jgi:hypothetical protein
VIDALPVAPAWLLLVAAIGLYLVDAAQLLFVNELLFVRDGSQWHVLCPLGRPELARRYLVLPNVLRPDLALLRMAWPVRNSASKTAEPTAIGTLEATLEGLAPLRWLCLTLFVALFLLAPPAFIYYGAPGFLVVLSAAYLLVLVTLVWLLRMRSRVGLPWNVVGALAFESLICIPYSINVYRKLTLRLLPRDLDVVTAATALVATSERPDFLARMDRIAAERLEWLNPGSTESRSLVAVRRELAAMRDRHEP